MAGVSRGAVEMEKSVLIGRPGLVHAGSPSDALGIVRPGHVRGERMLKSLRFSQPSQVSEGLCSMRNAYQVIWKAEGKYIHTYIHDA